MRALGLGALVLAGLAGGFVVVLASLGYFERSANQPFAATFQLKAEQPWSVKLLAGWGGTSVRGTYVAAQSAKLALPLERLPMQDLALDIELSLVATGKPLAMMVTANGAALGAVQLASSGTHRLLLPLAAIRRANAVELTFTVSQLTDGLLIEAISLRETTTLDGLSGHLDVCANGSVIGWAMSNELAAPVTVKSEGRNSQTIMPSLTRPDIKRGGRPLDVGFNARLSPPLRPGEQIEVLLPNGRPLPGSPCKG